MANSPVRLPGSETSEFHPSWTGKQTVTCQSQVPYRVREDLRGKQSGSMRKALRAEPQNRSSAFPARKGIPVSVKIAAHACVADDATLLLIMFSDQSAAPEWSLSEGAQGDASRLISLELDLAAARKARHTPQIGTFH
jgi:hypothetical protein